MRWLTAMDAQFLYAEEQRPAAMQHTLKVSIIRPGPEGYHFDLVKEALRSRLVLLPPLRWRLQRVVGDLHHPVWIEDPDFNFDFHVRRMGCPQPGTRLELCELISDIAGRPLDKTKPLWEAHIIEGLDDGTFAIVMKVHHSVADGVASSQLLDSVYDLSPDADPPPVDDWEPEEPPSAFRLWLASIGEFGRTGVKTIPHAMRTAWRGWRLKRMQGLTTVDLPPKAFQAESTMFNGVLTPHRQFTTVTTSLSDLKEIRAAFGTTINDVVLAVTAGGLRRYLSRRGEPIDNHLVGSVPVSTRAEGERPKWGNHLAVIYVRLPVHIADPVERLQASRVAANQAKDDLARTLGARLENVIDHLPVFATKLLGALLLLQIKAGKPAHNLIVSNVPGPRQTLYAGDAKVESFFSMGPLSETVGLNITAWSYGDDMNVCLLSCSDMVPDLWELTNDLRDELADLLTLARAQGAAPDQSVSA